jgi:hypothetical protein
MPIVPRMLAALLLGLTAAVLGCGSANPGQALPATRAPASLPASTRSHVVVIVMENEELSAVVGGSQTPYVTGLAHRYALANGYYAIAHPSLPNYLAITGGSTFGIHSDCTSCSVSAPNIVDQLEAAKVSWKAYMEGLPSACDTTAGTGGYAKRHDPFLYYRDVAANRARCRKVAPYTQLNTDLAAGRLSTFSWITPNLCDDGHDCSLATADRYLAGVVPALLRELGPHGVLFLTWDEGSSNRGCCRAQARGGRVALVAAGADVRPGFTTSIAYDHYSLLRTVEDSLGLPHLGSAASSATRPLNALFQRPPRVR